MKKIIFYSVLAVSLTGCGALERSFIDEMDRESEGFFQAGRDFPVVSGDSGEAFRSRDEVLKRTPASKRRKGLERETQSIKDELREKEALLNEEEMYNYGKVLKYLPLDPDKLYYLSLDGKEREDYIQSKKMEYAEDNGKSKDIVKKRSVHGDDIYLGMEKDEVLKIWGRPARVEIAGNPRNQNERWSFTEDGTVKQIYFEAGKVNGWALDL